MYYNINLNKIIMKKTLVILSLAVLACACGQEINTVKVAGDYGYMKLAMSADEAMDQVKSTTVASEDLANWHVTVTGEKLQDPFECTANNLASKAFEAGTYDVEVYNYVDDAAANAANEGWGAARYTGKTEGVTVEKGKTNPVTVECGKAKNARFTVVFTESFTSILDEEEVASYTFTYSARNIVFSSTTSAKWAYEQASKEVGYTLSYKYGGATKTYNGTFAMGAAGTEKKVNVMANSNGTITLTITYDETFDAADDETVTIDAATGKVIEPAAE